MKEILNKLGQQQRQALYEKMKHQYWKELAKLDEELDKMLYTREDIEDKKIIGLKIYAEKGICCCLHRWFRQTILKGG